LAPRSLREDERDRIEYEGMPNLSETLVSDLIEIAGVLLSGARALPPIEERSGPPSGAGDRRGLNSGTS